MSNSQTLRETHTKFSGGKNIFNEKAKSHEKSVVSVANEIFKIMSEKYPEYTFKMKKTLTKMEIAKELGRKNYKPENENSFVKPDGGILCVKIKNKLYPILISEAKKQGTNDERLLEGKNEQSKGNAIERAHKNYNEFLLCYCSKLSYLPYIMFAHGCDFHKGSSINDRLDAMTLYLPRNQLYIGKEKVANIFLQIKPFDENFMFDKMLAVAETSLQILKKENNV